VTGGSLPARGRPPQAAARRAGLEFVEKLLTANLTSTDPTKWNTGMLRRIPLVTSIVDLVGAPRRPGPPRHQGEVQRLALVPQLTAFFTNAAILASSAAVNSVSAKAVGHMAPSSRFAASWKPNVEYLELYFCPLWKKQTTLPSLA
jgi:hypothetical protein